MLRSRKQRQALVDTYLEKHHPELLKQPVELDLASVKDIPSNLKEFYQNVGYFINQKTNEYVTTLADHQIQTWADRWISKYRLYLKAQKIGLSMQFLLEDFHIALTRGRGKEILIISQSKDKARDHIQDLKKMILNSIYSDFLIDKPITEEALLRDERSKIDTIYLRNPENPSQTTKIIALGVTSVGSLISFKRVCHIHMSDVTLADMTEERFNEAFGGAFSRLANTDGTMVIEGPPRGPSGPVFNIVDEDDSLKKDGIVIELDEGKEIQTPSGFLVRRYTFKVGIECGMITLEFIEKERRRLGVLFGMYYEADFYSTDQTWFDKDSINQTSVEATELYDAF
jgi:hypothetical protein